MKRRELIEIGLITAGMLVGAAGLFVGGAIFGMKKGNEEGEKSGFNKGAQAQYDHMVGQKVKAPIGFNINEEAEGNE